MLRIPVLVRFSDFLLASADHLANVGRHAVSQPLADPEVPEPVGSHLHTCLIQQGVQFTLNLIQTIFCFLDRTKMGERYRVRISQSLANQLKALGSPAFPGTYVKWREYQ